MPIMHREIFNSFTWRKTPQGDEYSRRWYKFLLNKNYKSEFYLTTGYRTLFVTSSQLPDELKNQLIKDLSKVKL